MFSGLFSQSMIKIAGNQIIQYRQISTAYEAKSALNMSKQLLRREVEEKSPPENGSITTSVGTVKIEQEENEESFIIALTLMTNSGAEYSDSLSILKPEPQDEENTEPSPNQKPDTETDQEEEESDTDAEPEIELDDKSEPISKPSPELEPEIPQTTPNKNDHS
jgi:hypothetical protein